MSFRRSGLQEALFVPGTHAFRVWGYGTTDPLEQVLAPDYFALARTLLRAGELIYINVRPRTGRGSEAEAGEPRMALVMAQAAEGDAEAAGGSVRLVPGLRPSARLSGRGGRPGVDGRGTAGAGQARPRSPARQPEQEIGPHPGRGRLGRRIKEFPGNFRVSGNFARPDSNFP